MALMALSPMYRDQHIPPEKQFHIHSKILRTTSTWDPSRNLCWENNQRSEQRFMNMDVYSSIFIVKNCKHSKCSPIGFS